MADIREIYPEIPSILLSCIAASVGSERLFRILRDYDEAKKRKDREDGLDDVHVDHNDRVVVFVDRTGPETR